MFYQPFTNKKDILRTQFHRCSWPLIMGWTLKYGLIEEIWLPCNKKYTRRNMTKWKTNVISNLYPGIKGLINNMYIVPVFFCLDNEWMVVVLNIYITCFWQIQQKIHFLSKEFWTELSSLFPVVAL